MTNDKWISTSIGSSTRQLEVARDHDRLSLVYLVYFVQPNYDAEINVSIAVRAPTNPLASPVMNGVYLYTKFSAKQHGLVLMQSMRA